MVDASALNGGDVATVATRVTWGIARLTFDSIRAGSFGTFTASTASAASGAISINATSGTGSAGPFTLATIYFTTSASTGSTSVVPSLPQSAASQAGSDLTSLIMKRAMDVCVRTPAGKFGDANGDTFVDIIDAQQIARSGVGLPVANPSALASAGDVNDDGAVNIIDAQQVARFSVGLSSVSRTNTPYFTVPAVAGVTATPATSTLGTGQTVQLTATPRDGANASIAGCVPRAWTSLTPNVASVDSGGLVTALAIGTATIRATAGGQVADVTVLVAAVAPDPVIVAAGDIACGADSDPALPCQHAAVAALVTSIGPASVLLLGDNQYENGTLADYNTYYNASWGSFMNITRPVPGNHEYNTAGASGYYDYFNGSGVQSGRAGDRSKGYYSFSVGAWHLIALNSNCESVACGAGSAQEQWLRADLAASASACVLAYWHHPLFSSGLHGNLPETQALWTALQDYGAELVLTGHDHDYERFAPQNAFGTADDAAGIREFVVGTGGKGLREFGATSANSALRSNAAFGLLKLTLHAASYEWQFVPVPGSTLADAGTGTCSARTTPP